MSLYYPPLTLEQTLKIWNTHITRARQPPQIEADAMSLITCANEIFHRQLDPKFGPVWNGRQIRNAFQSAVSLAGFHTAEGEPINLQRKYFEHVFKVSDHFSNYVWSVNQRHSDAQLNMMRMVRSDDWAAPAGEGRMHTNPASFPYQQRGHQPMAEQTRLSAFPQSTYGQTIPRALTPIGGAPLSQQLIPHHPLPNNMLGTQQMGQPPWNTATQAQPQPQAQAQVQAQAQMQAQMQAQLQVPASQSQTAPFGSAAAGSGGAWNEAGAGAGAGEGLQKGQGQLFQPNSAVRPPAAQYTHQDMLPSLSTGMGPGLGPGPLLGLGQRAAQKPPGLG